MAAVAAVGAPVAVGAGTALGAAARAGRHVAINCAYASAMRTEVANSDEVFGHYVGHDEPSILFDSETPGAGNDMRYNLTLSTDPSARNPTQGQVVPVRTQWGGVVGYGHVRNAVLSGAGEHVSSRQRSQHPRPERVPQARGRGLHGDAVLPPPGWVPWPTWAVAVGSSSCDSTHWCAALNIDSLSLNPVTGQTNNTTCLSKVGEEYLNFAFITRSGVAQAPANPVDATLDTYTPRPSQDLFMNSGDHLNVAFTDTPDGLKVTINDLTTGQSGSMIASPSNGFAQVKFAPDGSSCTAIPYAFHPMYSTSTSKTRVTWAAGSYNVAFDTEIGHFQFCNGPTKIPATPFGLTADGTPTTCPSSDTEGKEPTPNRATGTICSVSLAKRRSSTRCRAAPTRTRRSTAPHTSRYGLTETRRCIHAVPLQQPGDRDELQRAVQPDGVRGRFAGDRIHLQPRDRGGMHPHSANRPSSADCLLPYTTSSTTRGGCVWAFGNNIPGQISNFGQNAQYGSLLRLDYTAAGGGSRSFYEDFRKIISNPCPHR